MRIAHVTSLAALLLAGTSSVAAHAQTTPAPVAVAPLPDSITSDLPRNAAPTHYAITVTPDLDGLTFAASSSADFELFEASPTITLNANNLEISSARLVPADGGAPIELTATTDAQRQTATFTAEETLPPGRYRLGKE